MDFRFAFCFLLLCSRQTSAKASPLFSEFADWAKKYNQTFDCTKDESQAFKNWVQNMDQINEYKTRHASSGGPLNFSYTVSVWELSYLSTLEACRQLNGLRPIEDSSQTIIEPRAAFIGGYTIKSVPPEVTFFNWTAEGAVIPAIRKQGERSRLTMIVSNVVFVNVNF